MLLRNAALQHQIDGINIRHGLQPALSSSGWTSGANLLILHGATPVMFECRVDGKLYARRAVPGDAHIIPQGTKLDIHISAPSELVLLSFDQSVLVAIANDLATEAAVRLTFQFSLRDPQIVNLVHALREELKSGCATGEVYVRQVGSALVRYLASRYTTQARTGPSVSDGLPPNRLRSVLDHIHTHLPTRLRLADLASKVRMSPQHFANLFRKSVGRAPHEYVLYERIERAKRLLAETDIAIADIALEVGFANQSHFTETFHRLAGVTPRRYRQTFENPNTANKPNVNKAS